jgi:cell division protein FtsB
MVRRAAPKSRAEPAPPTRADPEPESTAPNERVPGEPASVALPLDGLGVVGITRRRVAFLLGAIVAVWIVIVFARQVGEASTAAARAAQIEQQNDALAATVDGLHRELDSIQQQRFVLQQARASGLGSPDERPFRLAPGASPLPPNAPGSTAVRLGSVEHHETPLESWLSLLFGPAASPGG